MDQDQLVKAMIKTRIRALAYDMQSFLSGVSEVDVAKAIEEWKQLGSTSGGYPSLEGSK